MESIWVILILQAFIFGFFCSFIAKEKKRDSGSWFILGFLFSILAVFALIAVPKVEQKSAVGQNTAGSSKTVCPYCKEEILQDAILCKHCRSDLTEKKPITISQPVQKELSGKKVKNIICPKCRFTEEISYAIVISNEAFHKFEAHLDSSWEPYLKCPKCQKKFSFNLKR